MHDVFISYSHLDALVADAICHHLEEAGIRCWYAPRNIEPGVEWADAIIDAIEACKVMVLVFTNYSNDSRQVRREVDTAINAEKAIIPFKCTGNDPTGSMRYYLSTLHWLDAVDTPLEASIEELRGRIEGLLGSKAAPQATSDADHSTTAPKQTHDATTKAPSRASSEAPQATPATPEATPTTPQAKTKTLLVAGAAALALVGALGIAALNGRGNTDATPVDAETTQTQETSESAAAPSDDATEGKKDTSSGSSTGTSASTSGNTSESGKKEQDEEASAAVTPAPGDEEAADNYLYTIQSGDTVRLDRYFGPETAQLVIPTTIEGLRVSIIGEKCFEDCTWIEELVLPEGLEIIQYRAFYGCSNLKEMNIPSTLYKILGWAFAHTALKSMVFPETFTDLDYGVFYSCADLETVVLPPAVDYLGENTFRYCESLKTVTISAPEPDINAKAFEPNTNVTIIGVAGSYTEKYAKGMGLAFQAL